MTAAEEALKARLVPGIAFHGAPEYRRAFLTESGRDVWEVVAIYKGAGEDIDQTIARGDLSRRDVKSALLYYAQFAAEIDELIALRRSPLGLDS